MFRGERNYPAGTEMVRLALEPERGNWLTRALTRIVANTSPTTVIGPHAALAQHLRVYRAVPVDFLAHQTNRSTANIREDLNHLAGVVEFYIQD